MALHTSNHRVYKRYNSNDPSLTEAERLMYTTGWSRKYVGNTGADLVVVKENQDRPGKESINGETSIDKKRYKSLKAHNAALSKNTWSMWVKIFGYVYGKMYAEAMCDPRCKEYYLRWRNRGGAVIRSFIWPPPPGMVLGVRPGQWDGRQIRGPVDRLTPTYPNARQPPAEGAARAGRPPRPPGGGGPPGDDGSSGSSSGSSSSSSGSNDLASVSSSSSEPQQVDGDVSILSEESILEEQPRTMRGYNGEVIPVINVDDFSSQDDPYYQDMGDIMTVESSVEEVQPVQPVQPVPPPTQPSQQTNTESRSIIDEFRRLTKKLLQRAPLTREKRQQKSPSLQAMCRILEIMADTNSTLALLEANIPPFIDATYISFTIWMNSFYDHQRWANLADNLFENLKIIVAKLDLDVPYNSSVEEDLIDKCILWGHSSDSEDMLLKKISCLFAPPIQNGILKLQTPIYHPSDWTFQQFEVLDGIYQLSFISEPRNVDRGRLNIIRNRVALRLAAIFYKLWKERTPNNGQVIELSVKSVEAATPDDLRKINPIVTTTFANDVFVEVFKHPTSYVTIPTPLKVLSMEIHTTNTPLINLTFEILVGTKPAAKPLPGRKRKTVPK